MPHWNLTNVGSLNDLEMETLELVVARATEAHRAARQAHGEGTLRTGEEPETAAMRHALSTAAPGFVAAALIHAAVYRADELDLTQTQRVQLQHIASVLDPQVWARLTGA